MQKVRRRSVVAALAVGFALAANTGHAAPQAASPKSPTVEDWAAVGKLPDFTGVWELTFGGGGGRGAAGRGGGRGALPQGPQLTAAAAAKRKELQGQPREDNQTANCLPPGMRKLGLNGRIDIVKYAILQGWLKDS